MSKRKGSAASARRRSSKKHSIAVRLVPGSAAVETELGPSDDVDTALLQPAHLSSPCLLRQPSPSPPPPLPRPHVPLPLEQYPDMGAFDGPSPEYEDGSLSFSSPSQRTKGAVWSLKWRRVGP